MLFSTVLKWIVRMDFFHFESCTMGNKSFSNENDKPPGEAHVRGEVCVLRRASGRLSRGGAKNTDCSLRRGLPSTACTLFLGQSLLLRLLDTPTAHKERNPRGLSPRQGRATEELHP
jgi:hypothetical protein